MILQALTEYYEVLQKQGKAAAPGWGPVKVSYTLYPGACGVHPDRAAAREKNRPGSADHVPARPGETNRGCCVQLPL